jgi:HPt (histidine-containing phosphotransfer) domain-containing protein
MGERKIDIQEVAQTLRLPEDVIVELVEELLDSKDTFLEALKGAVVSGDNEKIRAEAHKLKGASSNLRVTSIADLALTMETAARSGESIDHQEMLVKISDEFDAVRTYLDSQSN